MSVFVSYSKEDADFANHLASELIKRNNYIWMAKWELQAGDSLLARSQVGITAMDALLIVISKTSISAAWCGKELTALTHELAEKHAIIIPVLMEDCEMPPPLKYKLYADFRKDFAAGLKEALEGIATGAVLEVEDGF
ncbi:MAG: toll/interleukin-1 receptor domain-containing protein [Elusimicrobia bacterium]|nr:toll/interleukin-1 receptor domain-containing protein [Elusimicrobiota bacterium]